MESERGGKKVTEEEGGGGMLLGQIGAGVPVS